MRALFLAAGEGTRLRPFTNSRPKVMVEVAGVPLVDYLVRWLVTNGVDELAVNLHYRPEPLLAYSEVAAASISVLDTPAEPQFLGSAGALVPLREFFLGAIPLSCYTGTC